MNLFLVISCFAYIALMLNSAQCTAPFQHQFRYKQGIIKISHDMPMNTPPTLLPSSFTSTSPTVNTTSTTKTNQILSRGVTRLALVLNCMLSRFAKKNDNFVFSPLNIAQTITTVMLGSAGKTETELTRLLVWAIGRQLDTKLPKFHEYLGDFFKLITSEDAGFESGTKLNMAGGVFIQRGFVVKQSFIDNSRRIYNDDILNVDFNGNEQGAADIINKWVTDKTNGKITQIVEPTFDAATRAIIVGALYFNGDWEYPFLAEFTKWQTFYLGADGKYGNENVLVEMMVNEAQVPYYEDQKRGFSTIGVPYKKKKVYMYIILPKLRTDVRNITSCITPKEIENVVKESRSNMKDVLYVIPKMKLDSKSNLRSPLEKLGARTLFDPQRANFSNIADGIYISDIVHKVNVDVNEIGTTAAAATSTTLNRGGYINFRVDRPFVFFIYDTEIGVMTFWGVVRKPTPFKPSIKNENDR